MIVLYFTSGPLPDVDGPQVPLHLSQLSRRSLLCCKPLHTKVNIDKRTSGDNYSHFN